MVDLLMPALSPTMEEGTLAKWYVKPGDVVKAGDVIADIETDKATMEFEAVDEGEIGEILVEAGTQGVKVGVPIARMAGDASDSPPSRPSAVLPPKDSGGDEVAQPISPRVDGESAGAAGEGGMSDLPLAPSVRRIAAESHLDLSTVKGTGKDGRITKGDALQATAGSQDGRIVASPYARKLAGEKGIDLAALKGSGPNGRIIERDVAAAHPGLKVEAKVEEQATDLPPSRPSAVLPPKDSGGDLKAAAAPTLEQMGIPPGSYDLKPLDGMRRTIAKRLTEAARDIPHFPLTIDLEIDALLATRKTINELLNKDGIRISVNDLIVKAAAMALKHSPDTNASYTPDGIAYHHHADIAIAVAIEGGLITPILRSAELKSLHEIAAETKDLVERAKARKLKPEEFMGGTFSVSNLGMFGIKSFGSIINPPQGAILSVGAGERRPVVRKDDLIEVATVMTVTLTCDHRVVDGATGAKWLSAFKTMIEKPTAMLA